MPDERELLAQEQAAQVVAAQQAEQLKNDVAGIYGELGAMSERLDKADAGIETIAKSLLRVEGKDGIKVEWPIIGLDRGNAGADQQNATPALNQFPINIIENGTLEILTVYSLESPEDFEE